MYYICLLHGHWHVSKNIKCSTMFKGSKTWGRLKNSRKGVESICCLVERTVKHERSVRSGELEERWFSSVVHVGGAWKGCSLSQVLGNVAGGHSMSKNCLEVLPSWCQGRPANGCQEFIMVTGHKQRAAEDVFGCSPLKAFQAVSLCSA